MKISYWKNVGATFVALAMIMASAAPAFAGHWTASYSSNGVSASDEETPTPPGWGTDSNTIGNDGKTYSFNKGRIQATLTWVPDNSGDTAPLQIRVEESSFAEAHIFDTHAITQEEFATTLLNGLESPVEQYGFEGNDAYRVASGTRVSVINTNGGSVVQTSINIHVEGHCPLIAGPVETYCRYTVRVLP